MRHDAVPVRAYARPPNPPRLGLGQLLNECAQTDPPLARRRREGCSVIGVQTNRQRPGHTWHRNAATGHAEPTRQAACTVLALCDMKTLYLRNVPDDVVRRLEALAARDGASVSAVAVRELADVSRRADNPALMGALPDLQVDVRTIVDDLASERAAR